MAISTLHTIKRYDGTGTDAPYAIDFQFLDATDIRIVVTDALGAETVLSNGVDYEITGGDGSTGEATLTEVYDATYSIAIMRRTALIQPADLIETGQFSPSTVERQLDRAILLLQENAAVDVGSAFRVTEDSDAPAPIDATTPANTVVGYDADGNAVLISRDALGSQGSQGNQGYQGNQGTQGFQGDQGAIGAQGTQGDQGNQGFQGVQGDQGFQGTQGFIGSVGPQGVQGVQGYQGFQGTQGTQGVQGPVSDAPIRLTSNFTTTLATNTDTAFSFAIGANEVWLIECQMTVSSGAAGIKLQASVPTGGTVEGQMHVGNGTTNAQTRLSAINTLTTLTSSGSLSNDSVRVAMLVVNGVNAGTCAIGAASVTAGQTTTIVAGSFLTRQEF